MPNNSITQNKKFGRIVVLVDMDCFFCQVEEKWDLNLKGKPVAVVQYNEWRGGGIIAVNYVARAQGVTRYMRGDEAKAKCPEIVLVKVPNLNDKGNMSKYRDAGQEVAEVLQRYSKLLHRASVDEAYLDITQAVQERFQDMNKLIYALKAQDLANTYAVGYSEFEEYMHRVRSILVDPDIYDMTEAFSITQDDTDLPAVRSSDLRLIIAATIVNEMRAAVKADTGYECSAGIAHNKILAKLACGMNKPNKQTILPLSSIAELFSTLPVRKIRGLGGKFGEEVCESLGIRFLGELLQHSEMGLQRKFDEKNGTWLYNICRGIDLEPVVARFHPKSIGCSKQFSGPTSLSDIDTLHHWLKELANELCIRLEKDISENNRKPTQLVTSYAQDVDGRRINSSRSAPLSSCEREVIAKSSFELIKANTKPFLRAGSDKTLHFPMRLLSISVGKFEPLGSAQSKLKQMFANQAAKKRRSSEEASTSSVNTERHFEAEVTKGFDTENKANTYKEHGMKNLLTTLNSKTTEKSVKKIDDITEACLKPPARVLTQLQAEDEDDLDDLIQLFDAKSTETPQADNNFEQKETGDLKKGSIKATKSNEICKGMQEIPFHYNVNCSADDSSDLSDLEELVNAVEKQQQNKYITKVLTSTEKTSETIANFQDDCTKNDKKCVDNHLGKEGKEKQRNVFKISDSVLTSKPHETVISKPLTSCTIKANKSVENDCDFIKKEDINTEYRTENNNIPNRLSENVNNSYDSGVEVGVKNDLNVEKNNYFPNCTSQTTVNTENAPAPVKKIKLSESPTCAVPQANQSDILPQPDYKLTYAEFAIPEIPNISLDLLHIKCAICGEQIRADERSVQTHQDLHLAQQVSQQQRAEFRIEIQNKILPNKNNSKESKKKPAATAKTSEKITKFFGTSITATITSTVTPKKTTLSSTQQSVNMVNLFDGDINTENMLTTCDKCQRSIKQVDMLEHQDYHLAQEIQKEFNSSGVPNTHMKKCPIQSETKLNRSRNTSNNNSNNKGKRKAVQGNASKSVNTSIQKFFSHPSITE